MSRVAFASPPGPEAPGAGWLALPIAMILPAAVVLGMSPSVVLGLVVVLGVVALALEWEVLVALLIGAGFFLGPLKIGHGGWLAYAIPDTLGALVLVRWLAGELGQRGALIRSHPLLPPFLALAAYLLLQIVNPEAPFVRSVFGLRSWLMYTAFVFVGYAGYRGLDQIERLYRVLVLLGVVTSAYGIWQWRQGPAGMAALGGQYASYAETYGLMPWETTEGGPIFRAISTFTSATSFALNTALPILVAASLVLSPRARWAGKLLAAAAIAFMGGAMATSGSRFGPAFLVGAVLVIGALYGSARILVLAVPLALLGVEIGAAITMDSMSARFLTLLEPDTYFWKWFNPLVGGFMIGVDYPFGKGLGYAAGLPTFADADALRDLPAGSTNTIDSGYGMVAAELGVIGLPIFLWFAVTVGIAGLRAWRALPVASRAMFLMPAVWAVIFPVFTLFAAPHASLPTSAYVWLLIGMFLRAGQGEPAGATGRQ